MFVSSMSNRAQNYVKIPSHATFLRFFYLLSHSYFVVWEIFYTFVSDMAVMTFPAFKASVFGRVRKGANPSAGCQFFELIHFAATSF